MFSLSAYADLPWLDQLLHMTHFLLCGLAVLIACIPLLAEKGSAGHKLGGMIYIPIAMAALILSTFIAWREQNSILFCFNCFCSYLLLSGWRAVHEGKTPGTIDWIIPGILFMLGAIVAWYAMANDLGLRSFYLLVFSANAFFLSWRDWRHLRRRATLSKHKIFFSSSYYGATAPLSSWISRHVSGMVGSVLANLSVIVLTLLPLELHWLWPVSLILMAAWVRWKQLEKRRRVSDALPEILKPNFAKSPHSRRSGNNDIRRAA